MRKKVIEGRRLLKLKPYEIGQKDKREKRGRRKIKGKCLGKERLLL